ncbi:sulfur carrier protein ThiS [Granulosicoccaceae sp. 1_MG-2023]|nr:sulfur carrier protein ThiS [Granulosicoccaceae sp. 1_MG-2023]
MNTKPVTVILNGKPCPLHEPSLNALLAEHTANTPSFAVAVNARFVPRSAYDGVELHEGDRVEILIPMQGG